MRLERSSVLAVLAATHGECSKTGRSRMSEKLGIERVNLRQL